MNYWSWSYKFTLFKKVKDQVLLGLWTCRVHVPELGKSLLAWGILVFSPLFGESKYGCHGCPAKTSWAAIGHRILVQMFPVGWARVAWGDMFVGLHSGNCKHIGVYELHSQIIKTTCEATRCCSAGSDCFHETYLNS